MDTLNAISEELSQRNDFVKALVIAMQKEIDKLKAELSMVRAHGARGICFLPWSSNGQLETKKV